MSKLPTWEQAEESCESGNGTALERFIYENEPQAFDDEWRKDLAAAIAEQRQPAVTHHCPACAAAATELAEARDDRELLVNRLRSVTALNEQLTLEAAEARGAAKRMERELADLRARLAATCNEYGRELLNGEDPATLLPDLLAELRDLLAEGGEK